MVGKVAIIHGLGRIIMTRLAPTKVTYERIMIPTDFSEISRKSLEYAIGIAKGYGSRLLLVRVDEPINPITPPEAAWIDDERKQQHWKQQLEQKGAELRSEGFHAEALSVSGSVQNEILSLVKERKIDLIVMASHGRVGLNRLFFGSETEAVIRHASCPVLVIGPAALARSMHTWPPRQVICATTLDPDAAWIAAYAYRLAQEHKADFMMFNVEDPLNLAKNQDWVCFESAFKMSLPDAVPSGDSLRLLFGDRPGSRIIDLAKELCTDLIVMGARTTYTAADHLRRGTVPQVVTEAPCPVMTLRQA
jgi:nucleotide-binding universal stress UspA family protein